MMKRRTSQCSDLAVAAGLRDDEMTPAESCDDDAAFNFNSNRRSWLIDSPSDLPSADCEHAETTPGAATDHQSSATSTIGSGRLAALVDPALAALFMAARLIAVNDRERC